MAQFGLGDDTWRSMMEGLVSGRYSLLLGAGASYGAVNGEGDSLPLGKQLGLDLQDRYGFPAFPDGTGLRSIYDLAVLAANKNGLEPPATYIASRFTNCPPLEWYKHIVRIPWHIIWTLNIDDVLENAYTAYHAESRQQLRPVSWDSNDIFHREPVDRVTAVHLHGRASAKNLVFGSLEYLAGLRRAGPAHQLFWDSWAAAPAIVVGATLADEIDLAAPLSEPRIQGTDGPPSLIVLPHVSDFDRYRLDATGLVIVESTAEEFFAAVAQDWADTVSAMGEKALEQSDGIDPNHAYFLQHFSQLSRKTDRNHDFFKGDAPNYEDIESERDARRLLPGLDSYQTGLHSATELSVLAFVGTFSGTTTVELRFLHDSECSGYTVRQFDSDAAFNVNSLVWAAKRDSKLLLRISDLHDFGTELERLRRAVKHADVPLRLVTTLRSSRLPHLEAALGSALTVVPVSGRLRDTEIDGLINALSKHDRLALISKLKPNPRRDYFRVTHKRDMIEALAELSQGRGFTDRVIADLDEAVKFGDGSLSDIVMISAEIGYPIPVAIASRAIGCGVAEVRSAINDGELSALVIIDRNLIIPRQWTLTARVSTQVRDTNRRFNVAQSLAKALAPYQSKQTISQRTRPARIIAQLMDADRIHDWFGTNRSNEWYESLYSEYSWNSRYWEQRALAEARDAAPRWEKAHSWASEAVSQHADAYSLNTLGHVLIQRALAERRLDLDLFYSGLAQVKEAEKVMRRPTGHPYVTALASLRRAYVHPSVNDAERQRLRGTFNRWAEDARNSQSWSVASAQAPIQSQIEKFLRVLPRP